MARVEVGREDSPSLLELQLTVAATLRLQWWCLGLLRHAIEVEPLVTEVHRLVD